MTHEVRLEREVPWAEATARLAQRGMALQMRMIDGALAAPDDQPPDGWREVRVAHAGEMVTVRRVPGGVQVVAWENASPAQRQLWDALAWAFASAGGARGPTSTSGG